MSVCSKINDNHLEVGVGGLREHTALARSLGDTTLQFDVTRLTPRVSPRVLHQVVVSTILSAITNGKDAVVKIVTTVSSEDTRLVQLEGGLVSLNGDSDGPG
jgi:hypothetical protein